MKGELLPRMKRALGELGYFIFEEDSLAEVSRLLTDAGVRDYVILDKLGESEVRFGKVTYKFSYYIVAVPQEGCKNKCEDDYECFIKCYNHLKEKIVKALEEGKSRRKIEEILSRIGDKLEE